MFVIGLPFSRYLGLRTERFVQLGARMWDRSRGAYPVRVGRSEMRMGTMPRQMNAGREQSPRGTTRATESFPAARSAARRSLRRCASARALSRGALGLPGGVGRGECVPQRTPASRGGSGPGRLPGGSHLQSAAYRSQLPAVQGLGESRQGPSGESPALSRAASGSNMRAVSTPGGAQASVCPKDACPKEPKRRASRPVGSLARCPPSRTG